MLAATVASVSNVSRSEMENQNASYHGSSSGFAPAQCTPIPQPSLGFQRIIQGNGTTVGTVISLQCPDKHKLIGDNVKCVMAANSTHWEGVTYCKPLSYNEAHGFHLAVLISIVSTAIIFLMSMAFITCCLVDCIENSKRKKLEKEQDHQQDTDRPRYSNKSRNNNNNKIMEKELTQWDQHNPGQGERSHLCRCLQQYGHDPSGASARCPYSASSTPLLGHNRPLLPQSSEYSQPYSDNHNVHQYMMPNASLARHYGAQRNSLPQVLKQSDRPNTNSAKDFSIQIISV